MSGTEFNLPWLDEPLIALSEALAAERLPHAILIEGAEGVGKQILARRLSASLLCTNRDHAHRPCGKCQACRLFVAGNHPDFRAVAPEEGKLSIGVDQVRSLISALVLTGQISTSRVGLIAPAQAMTSAAANSLLKTLEEPPLGTVLILVTSRPAALPATVRSRCQGVRVGIPQTDAALAWLSAQDKGVDWAPLLSLAGGAPLKALAFMQSGHAGLDARLTEDICQILLGRVDPLKVAEGWDKTGAALCLDWLYRQLLLLAHARALGASPVGPLQKAGKNIDLESLFGYADDLLRGRAILDTAANTRLILEGLLVPWMRGLKTDFKTTQAKRA